MTFAARSRSFIVAKFLTLRHADVFCVPERTRTRFEKDNRMRLYKIFRSKNNYPLRKGVKSKIYSCKYKSNLKTSLKKTLILFRQIDKKITFYNLYINIF